MNTHNEAQQIKPSKDNPPQQASLSAEGPKFLSNAEKRRYEMQAKQAVNGPEKQAECLDEVKRLNKEDV